MNNGNLFAEAPRAMTLSQFTTAIGNAVRMSPALQGAWVVAELSDVRVNGGHCYMELIEKNASGQTVAKLRATIWAQRFQYIRQKFIAATGREVMTGMKVMLYGAAAHHSLYGLSFSVGDIDPSYTLGDMERLRREILERLYREGVIGRNRALMMPEAPQRIAVISAEGAAGYGDFINQLTGNADGFVFYPFLFPAVMQGDRTSGSVRAALELIEQTIDLWDCVAIVRGGGATTDLNGFDDYELARAVAMFPLPVVVGIGHERDRTVLDEIAHTRMKTPTAVAAFFTDTLRNSYSRVRTSVDVIMRYSADRLQGEQRRVANIEVMLPAIADARLKAARAELERDMTKIPMLVSARLVSASGKLDILGKMVEVQAVAQTAKANQKLYDIREKLALASANLLKRENARIVNLEGMIEVLSPDNTLKRGYSITRINGRAVTDASRLKKGDEIVTRLYDGEVKSEVI